jgi:hypothetical protein
MIMPSADKMEGKLEYSNSSNKNANWTTISGNQLGIIYQEL